MRLTRVVVAGLAAVLISAGGYGWYVANDAPQHRAPKSARPAPQQTQPAPPQAGHRAPDTATPEHAKPRPDGDQPHASTRPPGNRPGRPFVIPYPGGFGPWWGYPYGYPYGYPAQPPWWAIADWARADIRLDVSPKDASVYVDGYYVGRVDDFDGIFQHLIVTPEPHHIDIRKPEYVTLAFDVNLEPGQTITYRRTMEPKTEESPDIAP